MIIEARAKTFHKRPDTIFRIPLIQKTKEPITNSSGIKKIFLSSKKHDGIFQKHPRFELLEKLLSRDIKQANMQDESTEEFGQKKKEKRLHL